ncbi:hypothetical protein E4U61_000272, partial [Claviceps capensis]
MTTADPNISTLEAGSEKGTNTTVVARTGFFENTVVFTPFFPPGFDFLLFPEKPVFATTVVFVPFSEQASSVDIFGSTVAI